MRDKEYLQTLEYAIKVLIRKVEHLESRLDVDQQTGHENGYMKPEICRYQQRYRWATGIKHRPSRLK